MATAHKKVILRRFLGDVLPGYLPGSGFVEGEILSLLDLDGRVQPIALRQVKCVFFVRDFNLGDTANPERLTRRSFLSRPRVDGLWLRLTFRETGEVIEGLAPTDTSLLDDLTGDAGLQFAPPDTRSNTQRIYVPRMAIQTLELLAVITSAAARKANLTPTGRLTSQQAQQPLFSERKPDEVSESDL